MTWELYCDQCRYPYLISMYSYEWEGFTLQYCLLDCGRGRGHVLRAAKATDTMLIGGERIDSSGKIVQSGPRSALDHQGEE
jgi:hypothetical protein